jgi:hypothetical protein
MKDLEMMGWFEGRILVTMRKEDRSGVVFRREPHVVYEGLNIFGAGSAKKIHRYKTWDDMTDDGWTIRRNRGR